ncbi:NAD(P)/FAD-dependent oxidoreductase [Actinacidiphila oryziradicis]|uniref:FAD-dependent oxidoreductase n=1 Tax=Actinacidiphila oryziradicis TaxID=2571141 RepID=A0A4U0RS12_9ACTN|nr:FAD-dependent oxidoreductase [Actinacidiphila oryziradicis]TJZ98835.1 FAD-dependent oxidoreductase [Actinacidiphila oryziradicis]
MSAEHPRTDVVVVGAGIIGTLIARELAGRGLGVLLLDPAPGRGASIGNAGLLVPSFTRPMADPSTLWEGLRGMTGGDASLTIGSLSPTVLGWLARFAAAARPGRAGRVAARLVGPARAAAGEYAKLAAETGLDLGVAGNGWLQVTRRPAVLRRKLALTRALAKEGIDHEVLTRAELRIREPELGSDLAGAVFFPGDASLDPAAATHAALVAAKLRGVIVHRARVTSLVRRHGEITAVRTDLGEFSATTYVLATGAGRPGGRGIQPGWGWSIDVPATEPPIGAPLIGLDDHVVFNPLAGRIRITGGMRIGGTPAHRHDHAATAAIRQAAERLVPALRDLPEGTVTRAARPMTPDGLPRVVRTGRNLITASGHGTLGMTLAPATAAAVALLLGPGARAAEVPR